MLSGAGQNRSALPHFLPSARTGAPGTAGPRRMPGQISGQSVSVAVNVVPPKARGDPSAIFQQSPWNQQCRGSSSISPPISQSPLSYGDVQKYLIITPSIKAIVNPGNPKSPRATNKPLGPLEPPKEPESAGREDFSPEPPPGQKTGTAPRSKLSPRQQPASTSVSEQPQVGRQVEGFVPPPETEERLADTQVPGLLPSEEPLLFSFSEELPSQSPAPEKNEPQLQPVGAPPPPAEELPIEESSDVQARFASDDELPTMSLTGIWNVTIHTVPDDGDCFFAAVGHFVHPNEEPGSAQATVRNDIEVPSPTWGGTKEHMCATAQKYQKNVFIVSRDYRTVNRNNPDAVKQSTDPADHQILSNAEYFDEDGNEHSIQAGEIANKLRPNDIVLYDRTDPDENPIERHFDALDFQPPSSEEPSPSKEPVPPPSSLDSVQQPPSKLSAEEKTTELAARRKSVAIQIQEERVVQTETAFKANAMDGHPYAEISSPLRQELIAHPLGFEIDRRQRAGKGACSTVYKSSDGTKVFKPLNDPTQSFELPSIFNDHHVPWNPIAPLQNVKFTFEVAKYVCAKFEVRNPFLEPEFGYTNDGTPGTAYPFIDMAGDFMHYPQNLTKEQWQQAFADLQVISMVATITRQSDLNPTNVVWGKDGLLYVIDYDMRSSASFTFEQAVNPSGKKRSPFGVGPVGLAKILPPGGREALSEGLKCAHGIAETIFTDSPEKGETEKYCTSDIAALSTPQLQEASFDITEYKTLGEAMKAIMQSTGSRLILHPLITQLSKVLVSELPTSPD
ncbi:MAG: hypothetical protein LBB18_01000 [Puniceicoccales bacterium]|jgi:hypothetical protein|nr:hypothetical protein [Puniceicoccales bacterium]